jgi:hypothetical protein
MPDIVDSFYTSFHHKEVYSLMPNSIACCIKIRNNHILDRSTSAFQDFDECVIVISLTDFGFI